MLTLLGMKTGNSHKTFKMRKIILSSGHGGKDPGASANGFIERDLAIEFRNLLAADLKANYYIEPVMDPNNNALAHTLSWLKGKFGSKDLLIDIHWNAGGGTGTEVIVADVFTPFEKSLAQGIADAISKVTGFKKRAGGVKRESETPRKRLAWMRPNAENVLIEMCFIDSKSDMGIYNANKLLIVREVSKVIFTFARL